MARSEARTSPPIGGTGAQYYKFTPAEDGDYTFSVELGQCRSDVDVVLCTDATCSDGGDFSGGGATTAQPEEPVYTLTGGTTYYIAVVLFCRRGSAVGEH